MSKLNRRDLRRVYRANRIVGYVLRAIIQGQERFVPIPWGMYESGIANRAVSSPHLAIARVLEASSGVSLTRYPLAV